MTHPFHLRYSTAAEAWKDAVPLGNGRLGAMVYGRADIERIPLNDDSLWYGKHIDRNNPALKDKLPEIRRLVFAGEMQRAEELMMRYMVGSPSGSRHYTFLGELDIALNQHLPFIMGGRPVPEPPEDYLSDLDLMSGILRIDHKQEGVTYHREMFISHPDQVMCLKYTVDTPGALNLAVKMARVTVSDATEEDNRRPGRRAGGGGWPASLADAVHTIDDATFLLRGRDAEVEFAAAVRVACKGGPENAFSQLLVDSADEVVLYVASCTGNRKEKPAIGRQSSAEGYATIHRKRRKNTRNRLRLHTRETNCYRPSESFSSCSPTVARNILPPFLRNSVSSTSQAK